ncbi:MAG TPA: phosphotransferase [Candidatus Dormibacteraeota bacterium]|nr:phosphotransferase [Candidatus Dormibacteraeota bacterium]
MKTLPDNPNLDHLRRQAKDLLAGLRDSRSEVSLADAQAALAQRYGFRTWTDLKAEVDRRRGQADVADETLARAVAACFGLGEVTGPMRSVARADEMGRRWSLKTERGRWAVRTMDTWRPIVDAETDVALQQAAAGARILLPAPVRSRSGAVVESICGHSWRAYEWIHSGPPLIAPVSAAITQEMGRILARIHRLGLPAPGRISPYHSSHRSAGWIAGAGPVPEAEWRELAARARARHADWAPALTEAIPTLVDLGTIGEGATPPPPVLCHNTLGPGSVRLGTLPRGAGGGGAGNGRGGLVVVGWEHAGGLPPSWELGEALTHWAVDPGNGVNVAGAQAMIEGYQSEAGALPPLDMAMFRGAVIALGNYVYDQVEDALTARDAGDQQHTARSVRHVLSQLSSRAESRANLVQLLDVAVATAHG